DRPRRSIAAAEDGRQGRRGVARLRRPRPRRRRISAAQFPRSPVTCTCPARPPGRGTCIGIATGRRRGAGLEVRRMLNVSLIAGAVCLSTALAGETPTAPALSTAAPAATQAKPPKPPKVVTHTVTGTLESYDATAKTLTVKSTKATWTFSASEAR